MKKTHCPNCGATGSTIGGLSCKNCGTYIGAKNEPEPLHDQFDTSEEVQASLESSTNVEKIRDPEPMGRAFRDID